MIVKVHPTMVPKSHPLAAVTGAYNAIFVESRDAGQLMFLGQGAGGAPTASAVMGDVVTVCRNRLRGSASQLQTGYTELAVAPLAQASARYYIRFDVVDRPGVLAACASIFGEHGVSLETVSQAQMEAAERPAGFEARLEVVTHQAQESSLEQVIAGLRAADFVGDQIRFMRIEGS